ACVESGGGGGLDDDMQGELKEAGTYHVIAISGGNIAIVAGLCLFVFRYLSIGPRASAALVMIALSAYGLLAEGGSSVARAVTMALIYFGARLIDHRSSPVNVVATSAAVLFSAAPLVATDAAFALTFGATLGLVTGMSRLIHPDARPRWMLPVTALFLASVCAEVALLPIAALTFSRVTIAGLVL